jgi:hypothetical protein
MYMIFKGKPMYSKEDNAWERVRPGNSDTKKNKGCHKIGETKT